MKLIKSKERMIYYLLLRIISYIQMKHNNFDMLRLMEEGLLTEGVLRETEILNGTIC